MESFHAATEYAMAKVSEVTDAAKNQVALYDLLILIYIYRYMKS